MAKKIVFLDRESLDATLKPFSFEHEYVEHESTWTPEDIVSRLQGAEIALINKVPMRADVLKQLPDLKLIAVAATGTDVVDKAQAKSQGITVVNIRNYAFNTVPEHVIGLMFALRRAIVPYANSVKRGDWAKSRQFCYFDYPIYDIAGSTLGIVGYGALGKSIAKRGEALGMKILAYDTFPQEGLSDFETVLTQSDVITLHVPLTPETKGLIGAAELKRMKKNAILINTARGGLWTRRRCWKPSRTAPSRARASTWWRRSRPRTATSSATRTCRTSSSRRTSPGRARRPCRSWPTNSSTTSRRSWRASRRTWSRGNATPPSSIQNLI